MDLGIDEREAARRCSRTASSATPTSTAARGASTSASSPTRSQEVVGDGAEHGRARPRGAARWRCSTPASRRSPTPPPRAFLGREKVKLTRIDGDRPRVALVADGLGGMHGVTHTLQQIRERGVPGLRGRGDRHRRRRRPPAERGRRDRHPVLRRARRSASRACPAIVDALAEGRYDLVHVVLARPGRRSAPGCSPGCSSCRVVGSYHTELAAYAGLRSGPGAARGARQRWRWRTFYGACDVVLSPSPASDERLRALGIAPERIGRWDRGVDLERFDPALRTPGLLPGEINVLYAGRLTKEKGVDLLADAFLAARRARPAAAPGAGRRRARGGARCASASATPPRSSAGWSGEELARAYASADAFLFASRDRHLRSGGARGPGQRPAGGRGRRRAGRRR